MRLKKLLEGVDGKIDPELQKLDITSVSADSRNVTKGGLFVAIKGTRSDGNKFVGEAFHKGAAVSIVEARESSLARMGGLIRVRDCRKALSVIAKNLYHSPSET